MKQGAEEKMEDSNMHKIHVSRQMKKHDRKMAAMEDKRSKRKGGRK